MTAPGETTFRKFLSEEEGPNWFAYVRNNPVNFVDPLGLSSESWVVNPDGTYTAGSGATIYGLSRVVLGQSSSDFVDEVIQLNGTNIVREGDIFSIPQVNSSRSQSHVTSTFPKPIIVIDIGHGGADGGAAYPLGSTWESADYIEAEIVRRLATEIQRQINSNYDLRFTRDITTNGGVLDYDRDGVESGSSESLEDRVAFANNSGATLFISLHVNASRNTSANGMLGYIDSSSVGGGSDKFLGLVWNELKSRGARNWGDSFRRVTDYYVLANTNMPAVLLEIGFITNSTDRRMFSSDQSIRAIAQSICEAIYEYY